MDLLTPTIPYLKWLQSFPFLLRPMQFFSILGAEVFYIAFLPVIFWAVSRRIGARLGALLLFSVVVNEICKVGFALPRPYWVLPWLKLSQEASFGFPSGHAQGAFLLWIYAAIQAKNRKLWVPLALLLALLITVSRNYLGVHYPIDSVGGALIGLTILTLTLLMGPGWIRFWHQLSIFQKLVFTTFMTLFLAGIYAMAMWRGISPHLMGYDNVAGGEYETAVQNALRGTAISQKLGGLYGLLVGLIFAARSVPFEARQTVKTLAPRLIAGFVGIAVFYFGLRVLGVKIGLDKTVAWNFARYFLTTLWIVLLAPLAFERLFPTQKSRVV